MNDYMSAAASLGMTLRLVLDVGEPRQLKHWVLRSSSTSGVVIMRLLCCAVLYKHRFCVRLISISVMIVNWNSP